MKRALLLCAALAASSCGGVERRTARNEVYAGGRDLAAAGRGALRVSWQREMTASRRGNYRPVEGAVAAIDESHGRLYVGASSGYFDALGLDGTALYRYELHESIESEPALDVAADEVYVATERGEIYALRASDGKLRWKVEAGAAIRQKPVLFRDALYVISEDDVIEGRARSDGSVLWAYKRERSEGFLVAGHAGLTLLEGGRLLAAFNDGVIALLDALDGRALWERHTEGDVPDTEPGRPRYVDADATPITVGDHVYAASFGAGLYCLDKGNGSVVWRAAEWTGITGLAATDDGALILVSADRGVARFDPQSRAAVWVKPSERGSFTAPVVFEGLLLLGDSRGSLVALDTGTGDELGRIDAGHGFAARPALAAGRGFALTNGGTLLALRIAGKSAE